MKNTILLVALMMWASVGFGQIFTEDFSAATSVDAWNTAGSATEFPGEVTLEWAETDGVEGSGGFRFGGTNGVGGAGRAYIITTTYTDIDFGGATNVKVSISVKSEGLVGTNVSLLSNIAGSVQNVPSTIAELDGANGGFVTFEMTHPAIDGAANSLFFEINVAAGAEQGHGGTIIIDNITITAEGDGGGSTDGNLLTNGDFSDLTDALVPYEQNTDGGWYGNGELREDGGATFYFANVETAGDAFAVNLSQVVPVTEGQRFTLSFDANTDEINSGRTMSVGLGDSQPDWTSVTQDVVLTGESQRFNLDITANGIGDTDSETRETRVIFDMGAAVGVVVIDNVSLVVNNDPGNEVPTPAAAPPAPTEPANEVISIFSDAYQSVTVNNFSADFDDSGFEEVDLDGNAVLRYDLGNFFGIQLANTIDLTSFTHMYFDYWIADETLPPGAVFNPKLSNHGNLPDAPGETSAIEFTNPIGEATTRTWLSFNVELDSFTPITAADRNSVLEILVTSAGTVGNIFIDNLIFYGGTPVSNEEDVFTPNEFALDQNYPNPFNPTTNISFNLPAAAEVTLEVYAINGQKVATLVDGFRNSGSHTVTFDATNLASGVYMYRLASGANVKVNKMLLIK